MVRAAALLLSLLALAACSTTTDRAIRGEQEHVADRIAADAARSRERADPSGVVRVRDGFWFGNRTSPARLGDPLPERLHDASTIRVFVPANTGRSRQDLYDALVSNLPYQLVIDPVSRALLDAEEGSGEAADGASRPGATVPPAPGGASPDRAGAAFFTDLDGLYEGSFLEGDLASPFHFEGTVLSLIGRVSRRLGFVGWYYESGRVILYVHQRRDFEFQVFPEDSVFWSEAETLVRQLCGECAVSVLPNLARISLVAQPFVLQRVGDALDRLNRRMTESLLVDVQLYTLRKTTSDEFSFNLNAVLSDAVRVGTLPSGESEEGVGGGEEGTEDEGGGEDPSTLSRLPSILQLGSVAAIVSGGAESGTGGEFVLNALSSVSDDVSVEGISLSVLNQRSQEFSLNQQDTYALPQQSSSTGTGDGREESSGQPTATRDSGFQVTLQPVLVRDSEVLLSLDIGYSRGVGRTDASQDLAVGETLSSQITRDFHHDLRVPLGDLVLLNVYQHADLLTSRSGTGRPSFWALGGGRSAQRIVTTYVLSLRTVRLKPVPAV